MPLAIFIIELFWGLFVVMQQKYMCSLAYRGWLLCFTPNLSDGRWKHKVLTCQARGLIRFLEFLKNWMDLYMLGAHSLEVWWLHGVKLQMSHRNVLHEVKHWVCNVITVFDCDFMFKKYVIKLCTWMNYVS